MILFEEELQKIINDYQKEIRTVSIDINHPLQDIDQGIEICLRYYYLLKTAVDQGILKTNTQEIQFFKEVKPMVVGQLLYFFYLQQIECERPKGTNELILKYLKEKLDSFNSFLQTKHICYLYYRKGSSYQDEQCFLRCNISHKSIFHYPVYILDMDFSTRYDNLFSNFRAHEKIIEDLTSQINLLEGSTKEQVFRNADHCCQSPFTWTDKKVSVTEISYALAVSRSINNGDVDVKKLGEYIGKMFNMEDLEIYRSFTDIQNRSNPTAFLDKITHALTTKIEDMKE